MNPENDTGRPIDPESIRDAFQAIRLTDEQWDRHATRIETELARGRRGSALTLAIGVAGVLLLILAVVVWQLAASRDDQGSADDTNVVAVVETPTPSSAPPESDSDAVEPVDEPSCEPSAATRVFASFVDHFNAGDFDALRAMLPAESDPHAPTSDAADVDPERLHGFFHYPDAAIADREAALDYLAGRHAAGERWQLTAQLMMVEAFEFGYDSADLEVVDAVIARQSGDLRPDELRGHAVINCALDLVVLWSFDSDRPSLATPITVEQFLDAADAYNVGEQRYVHLLVTIDLREDGGTLSNWEVLRIDGADANGNILQRVTVDSTDGERVITYMFDGAHWFLDQRGWQASGNAVAPSLPAEIVLARPEPARTADLIIARIDEIPENGAITLSQVLPLDPDEFFAIGQALDSPIVERWFEVVIQDGNVVLSRYRMVDESGNEILTPEIRFLELRRVEGADPDVFEPAPVLDGEAYQFRAPDPMPDGLQFLEQQRGADQLSETFRIEWRGVPLTLRVTPSRGGLDPRVPVEQWGAGAPERVVGYSGNWLVWRAIDGTETPAGAVWDDGRRRFELTFSAEDLPPEVTWDEATMVELVATLFAATNDETE